MTTDSVNTRELILEILLEVTEKGQYSHLVIRSVLDKYQYLDKRERAFLTRVAEGTIQRQIELDYILDQFSKVKVRKMKPVSRAILRMGVYQLKYMDSVPASAACNEAVKLAKKKGFGQLSGFVNGGTARCFAQPGSAYISRGERRCRKSLVGVLLDARNGSLRSGLVTTERNAQKRFLQRPFWKRRSPSARIWNGSRRRCSQSVLRRRALLRFLWIRKNIPDFRMHLRSLGLII